MEEALDEYIEAHCSPEDPVLYRLYRATNTQLTRPRMASGHMQGLLLRMLVGMVRPRRILEVGTYSGYSALAMASAMPPDGELFTFEINDEQEDFTRPWIDAAPEADFVFLDGDKRHYVDYYEMARRHLTPGGYIVADNTLWDGHVVDPAYDADPQTLGIRRFNDRVAADREVECVILPLRDGLTLIHHLA